MRPSREIVRKKLSDGLTALAWVAAEYYKINQQWVDADDYIQTMIILESLVEKGGFDKRHLVESFRRDRRTFIRGVSVPKNGAEHKGQLWRLRQSQDPDYTATTGITSGCAMKSIPMGVWHRDYVSTIRLADNVTRVTHGTDEARLVGILAALRHRHALHEIDDPRKLVSEWTHAAKSVWLYGSPAWDLVSKSVERAASIVERASGTDALASLMSRVGMMYYAWSCPVSAIFWSYVLDPEYKKIFRFVGSDKRFILPGDRQVLLDEDVLREYAEHVIKVHKGDQDFYLIDPAKTGRQDSDTFFSIAFSARAIRDAGFLDDGERASTIEDLGGEDWSLVLDAVSARWA